MNPTKFYKIKKTEKDCSNITDPKLWKDIQSIEMHNYQWIDNNYKPKVLVKLFYSLNNIYLNFKVFENKVKAKFTNFGEPVFKDSCVEFFINLFPQTHQEYFNFEFNAIGTALIGFGIAGNRTYLKENELEDLLIVSSINAPVDGLHGGDSWKLYCKIPINIIEKKYDIRFKGKEAVGNFYKCGDETEFEHYGTWNKINNPTPNFHLPQYFGKLLFE
ncbi:MAG: hypothetical protein L3J41_10220 [Melioribacteraceae bacterium]|nr:hypothetical protein [Melioribacteraceae bacterium]